jgi:hypothetical protein
MSLSSRQQLRTQGEGTVETAWNGGKRRSGIQVDANTGGSGLLLAVLRLAAVIDLAPVVLATCVQQHWLLLLAPVGALAALAMAPILGGFLPPGITALTNLGRVHRRVGRYGTDPTRCCWLAGFSLEALYASVLGYKI